MRVANITAAIAIVLWLGLVLRGRRSLEGVLVDQVPDFPTLTVIDFRMVVPLLMATALLAVAWLYNALGPWPLALGLVSVASLTAILPFLMIIGGGVQCPLTTQSRHSSELLDRLLVAESRMAVCRV